MRSDGASSFIAKECETKLKNLKRSHTVCVDHNKFSDKEAKKCSFFEEMQELFSNNNAIEPVTVPVKEYPLTLLVTATARYSGILIRY